MRLFIACSINDEIKEKIDNFVKKISVYEGKVKWVESKNLHLTLKFLGETEEAKLEKICSDLSRIVMPKTKISVEKTGMFPLTHKPKVFWVGLSGDIKSLANLQKDINKQMVKLGFKKEKRAFSPHITIGRVKGFVSNELIREMNNSNNFFGETVIENFHLIKSTLTKAGPIYDIVKSF